MSEAAFFSPRNDDAVGYALSIARNYLALLKQRNICLNRLSILEIGPGADFAAALVMTGLGASVTLADRFLQPWDDAFHPDFYRRFLEHYDGPGWAIEAVLARGGYDGVLRLLPQPAEALSSLEDGSV